jgi:hypothetical protein
VSNGASNETEQIRANIERTRAEMSRTIDAIQERLSPQQIADQVRSSVREQFEDAKNTVRDATIGKAESLMRNAGDTMHDARYSVTDTVRENPIPAAMVALGLGWLFMNRSTRPTRARIEQYTRHRTDGYRGDMGYYGSDMDYRRDMYRGDMAYYGGQAGTYEGYSAPRGIYSAGQQQNEGMLAEGQRRAADAAGQARHAAAEAANRAQSVAGDAANRVQGAASQATHAVGDAASRAQDAVGDAASRAQDAANEAAYRAQLAARDAARRASRTYDRVEDRFQRSLQENPLAVGAIALAIGAVAGLVLPQTERENQLMGEARDNLVEQAAHVAEDTADKVQQVAGEVAKDAQQKTAEKAREVGLTGNQ